MHYGMAYVDKHSLEQWISALQTVIAFLGSMHLSLVGLTADRQTGWPWLANRQNASIF